MPIYQYRCQQCRHLHEAMQKVSDPPITECPECGGEMKKIIAPAGIIFKGSGWHINDYSRSSAAKEETKSDKPAAESGSSSTESTPSPEKKESSGSQPSSDSSTSSQKVA